jgi:hypothetical protein
MEKYRGKTLDEWKEYIKKDNRMGIRTEKYILVLEEELSRLVQSNIVSLERTKKYARHQHYLGTQGKELVEFEDWESLG